MKFISTRGKAPELGFLDVVLKGLAPDGGLYLPVTWPQISKEEIASFANLTFSEIAFALISRFIGEEIEHDKLKEIIDASYRSFDHPSVTPLVEIEPNHFILELFHGPTLAFKDVAMQFLARIMNHALLERNQRATIVGATSGDTGSAAIEAFRGRDNIDIFILHPLGRTSEVQRRQMSTVLDENIFNIALKGNFDDCQKIVKTMFGNENFRNSTNLSGVNSINWGRILAQITYYFKAAADLGSPNREMDFTVPTGNFGDIFAGYGAKKMGLPIGKLNIATNENDILARALANGRYETGAVKPTTSPSMDIQVSSNFERLLFEALGRDGAATQRLMDSLTQSGSFSIPKIALKAIREDFSALRVSEEQVKNCMKESFEKSKYLADPHTGVAIYVAQKMKNKNNQMITLSTAHPAKFPDAVKNAMGISPILPEFLSDLFDKQEKYETLENNQSVIEDYILARTRV